MAQANEKSKPRVRFCWECGRQLRGNHHKEISVFGQKRIVHISCEEKLRKEGFVDEATD